jgi:hypothetical protein
VPTLTREQRLVDAVFSCVFTVTHRDYAATFARMPREQVAVWVAEQLRERGFDTRPVGAFWGVLTGGER